MPENFYKQLMDRDEAHRQRRNDANTQNTMLLQQQVQLDEDFKTAVRNGDDKLADEIRDKIEAAKLDAKYHAKRMEALQGTMRGDAEAIRLAKGLHGECKQEMAEITNAWNNEKTTMAKAMEVILACAERLGTLAAKGDVIYGRVQHAVELTGLNLPYIQNRANVDINTARKIGIIYPDIKEIELAFNRGRAKR